MFYLILTNLRLPLKLEKSKEIKTELDSGNKKIEGSMSVKPSFMSAELRIFFSLLRIKIK